MLFFMAFHYTDTIGSAMGFLFITPSDFHRKRALATRLLPAS